MSDHRELADQRDNEADRMERESERVAEGADESRSKLRAAQGDQLIPEAMGEDDPGQRDDGAPAQDADE